MKRIGKWIGWWMLPLVGLALVPRVAAEGAADSGIEVSVDPTVTYVTVDGNEGRFREDHWLDDDWSGGISHARFWKDFGDDLTLELTGRGIFEAEDFELTLDLTKQDAGFVRAGFEQFRHHYSSASGFFEGFSLAAFDPHRDLRLDNGRIWVEFGLVLPDLPKIVIGYERRYRDGEKSLLEWGTVSEGGVLRNTFPSVKKIDETVDILRLEITHTIGRVRLADEFRVEFYDSDTVRNNTSWNLDTATAKTVTIREHHEHTSFLNVFRMDSHLNEKFYWSLGYLFNDLSGDGGLNVMTPGPLLPFDRNWMTRVVDLSLDSHVLNLNAMSGPFAGLTFYGGLQGELTAQDGFADAFLTQGLNPTTRNLVRSDNEKQGLQENLGVRFTKLPFTTLYAEGKWTQQDNDLAEWETEDGGLLFQRRTETSVLRQDYAVGFNSAPVQRVHLAGRYRHRIHENDYDHDLDTIAGYPAFITAQDFTTDELMAKLTLRPLSKLSLAFSYQLVATDIDTATASVPLLAPGGGLQSGNYDANVYTFSATVTPVSRLYLTGLFSYHDTRTTAADNGAASIQTYEGDVFLLMGMAGYALTETADLNIEYTFYRSDNFTNNAADGLPLGLDNESHAGIIGLTEKLAENIILRLRYGIYYYNEASNGGIDDYLAHLAAATLSVKF